jgi:hypothetical protein
MTAFSSRRWRRGWWLATWALVVGIAAQLTGCATLSQLPVQVNSVGRWAPDQPIAGQAFRFERLPSTQNQSQAQSQQQALEDSARDALIQAGLRESADEGADVASVPLLIQLSGKVQALDPPPVRDPLWGWGSRGGIGFWGGPGSVHGGLGMQMSLSTPRLEREVRIVIRRRANADIVWDGSASTVYYGSGVVPSIDRALFQALLQDFPSGTGRPVVLRVTP